MVTGGVNTHGLLIYMAADNNLNPFGRLNDLREIRAAQSGQGWPMAIQFHSPPDEAEGIYSVAFRAGREIAGAKQAQGINTGDPVYLLEFLRWAVDALQCEQYSLIIWGHGSGALDFETQAELVGKAVGFDFTEDDSLTTDELRNALHGFFVTNGLRVLGFDACYMGSVEVATELAGLCDVYVGSEAPVPEMGWPYDLVLADIQALDNPTSRDVGTAVCRHFLSRFSPQKPACVSAVSTDRLDEVGTAFKDLVREMTAGLDDPAVFRAIHRARVKATRFGESFYDIGHFCANLHARLDGEGPVAAAAQAVGRACGQAVFANRAQGFPQATGLSVMFPPLPLPDKIRERYAALEFNKRTGWNGFVDAFHNG